MSGDTITVNLIDSLRHLASIKGTILLPEQSSWDKWGLPIITSVIGTIVGAAVSYLSTHFSNIQNEKKQKKERQRGTAALLKAQLDTLDYAFISIQHIGIENQIKLRGNLSGIEMNFHQNSWMLSKEAKETIKKAIEFASNAIQTSMTISNTNSASTAMSGLNSQLDLDKSNFRQAITVLETDISD